MSFLVRFSLRNPIVIFILSLLILAGGLFSTSRFKQEQLPDIAPPIVLVVATYPGASSSEIFNEISVPVERALHNVEGVNNVVAQSSNNVAIFQLEFDYNDDLQEKVSKTNELIQQLQLPAGIQNISVTRLSLTTQPIYYTSVLAPPGMSKQDFHTLVRKEVIPELNRAEGVAEVREYGLSEDGLFLKLDPQKLLNHQISLQEIVGVLQSNNLTVPLGEASLDGMTAPILMTGKIDTIDEIENLLIRTNPNITFGDIATITQSKDADIISTTNGETSVALNLVKALDANTSDVSYNIKESIKKLESDHNVRFIEISDTARDIDESISAMVREGGLGALFTALLILLFFRNIRSTLIAVVSIPLSILAALILVKSFTDVTLNIMTLGGMAVAVGRVVDDSIVVMENIIRRMQQEKISKELLTDATKEVGMAITSSTLTTVAVFAPLALVSGVVGKIFAPFALTMSLSLLASLLVAFTVVPSMMWFLFKRSTPKEHKEFFISPFYKRMLNWALNHKIIVLIVSLIIFLSSLPLGAIVGSTFLPETDYKYTLARMEMPEGTELSVMNEKANEIDEIIRNNEQVLASQVTVGEAYLEAASNNKNTVSWFIRLKSDTNTQKFMDEMKDTVDPGEGNTISFYQDGASNGIQIILTGDSKEQLHEAAELVTARLQEIEGTTGVKNNIDAGTPGIEIRLRSEDALAHGLTVAQASAMLQPLISDVPIGRIGSGLDSSIVYVTLKEDDVTSIDDVSNMTLYTPLGEEIQVHDIADVTQVQLPGTLQIRNNEEFVTVSGVITDDNTGKVNTEIQKLMQDLDLPEGVSYVLGGSTQNMQDMFSEMIMAMIAALAIVYVVMVISLGEGRAPFAILFSLPFALVGGLLGTLLANQPISMSSMIGLLMLIGIVVANAIVLVDRVQQQIRKGLSIRDSLIEAGGTRLRPILMTAIATVCALLPLALGTGGGTVISKGLASIVIGGLTTSTLLTLFIVPVVFELLYFRRARHERRQQQTKSLTM